jgi:hypothetical protein
MEISMNTVYRFTTLTLIMLALAGGFSQKAAAAAKAENLVRGVVGPVASNSSWSGFSAISLGFTAGATADISNMVLYTTARGSSTITAVTPVTLGGVSNPSINLASSTVCPIIEISNFNPCIVRLDPTKIVLSATSDYYLVVYFTPSDSNNGLIGATTPTIRLSSLMGWYVSSNQSQLTVGSPIPAGNSGSQPEFLMYVMTQ